MESRREKIELTAPAGGPIQLTAAINAGADSVYMGYKKFSARAYAENFDFAQLAWAVGKAHSAGKKIYLTLNTIIKDYEIPDLVDFLNKYLALCSDGVIIQDMGLLKILKDLFPDITVHASTQMNIHNSRSLEFAADCGFKRAVLAREMTLNEIKMLSRKNNVKLEVFGHGSQCYSFSGICYFSSFTGGRSGNRGRCTQPCRMKYEVISNDGKKIKKISEKPSFFISKNDLCTLRILPEIIESGIDALKIEGRMKTPEYVAIIIKAYRKYIDLYYSDPGKYRVEDEDIYKIEQIFSRELGTGYYEGVSRDIVGPDRSGSIGNFIGRIKEVFPSINNKSASIHISARTNIRAGDVIEIWTKKGNKRLDVIDPVQRIDRNKHEYILPVVHEEVFSLKDRVFKYFDKKLDEEAKSLYLYDPHRYGKTSEDVEKVHTSARLEQYIKEYGIQDKKNTTAVLMSKKIDLTLRIYSIKGLNDALATEADNIIISNTEELLKGVFSESRVIGKIINKKDSNSKKIIIDTPLIIYDRDMDILLKRLTALLGMGGVRIRVSNIGILEGLRELKIIQSNKYSIILGSPLNISNTFSAAFYNGYTGNISGWEFSPEIDLYEISDIIKYFKRNNSRDSVFTLFAHGFFRVMTARHKIDCGNKKDIWDSHVFLMDEKKYGFSISEEGSDITNIYNSKKICTLFDLERIVESGINDLVIDSIFTDMQDINTIITSYRKAITLLSQKKAVEYKKYVKTIKEKQLFMNYSRGHLFRGVE